MPHSRRYNLFALFLLACAAPPAGAEEVPLDAGAVRAAVLAETNAYRASKNMPQLKENAALEAAATAYAVYLAEHEKMSHTADGSNPPQTRLRPRIQGVLHLGERLEFFSPFGNDAGGGTRAQGHGRLEEVARP